jgi:hypothetical protein
MTLLAPIATKIMIKILQHETFPQLIAGIVHSFSEVKFLRPLHYGSYQVWNRVETLQKKKGKMGHHLVLTFRMTLLDEEEEEIAYDLHQFFLRLKGGEN